MEDGVCLPACACYKTAHGYCRLLVGLSTAGVGVGPNCWANVAYIELLVVVHEPPSLACSTRPQDAKGNDAQWKQTAGNRGRERPMLGQTMGFAGRWSNGGVGQCVVVTLLCMCRGGNVAQWYDNMVYRAVVVFEWWRCYTGVEELLGQDTHIRNMAMAIRLCNVSGD